MKVFRRFLAAGVVLLACAIAVWAANTLTSSTSNSTASVSTANLTFGSNVANGDLIIACDNWGNNVGTHAVTDNKSGGSNTYTAFLNNQTGITGLNDLYCAWAINSGSAAALTVTVTISGAGAGTHTLRIGIFDYNSSTGWASSPVDSVAGGNGANSTTGTTMANPGNITPSASGELVFSSIQWSNTVNTTSVTTCTERAAGGSGGSGWGNNGRVDSSDVLSSGTSATTCMYSWAASVGYSTLIQAFKPATTSAVVRHRAVQN
jgi:hypothetical protein